MFIRMSMASAKKSYIWDIYKKKRYTFPGNFSNKTMYSMFLYTLCHSFIHMCVYQGQELVTLIINLN